jgi:PAS domain S-box-containing protein
MDFRYLLDKNLSSVLHALPEDFNVLAMALESTNSGVVITDFRQPDNPIVFCNHAFENLSGYSREEVIGRNCRFLQGDDRLQDSLMFLREGIAQGLSVTVELRNYHKNGSVFWNELSIAPVRDGEGTVTHFIGIQNDVTRKKTLETDLKEQIDLLNNRLEKQNNYLTKVEEILFGMMNTTQESLVILDKNLHVVKANSNFYRIFKDTEEKVVGLPLAMIHNGQWKNQQLFLLLTAVINEDKPFDSFALHFSGPNDHCKEITIKGNKIQIAGIPKDFVLLTIRCLVSHAENSQSYDLLTLN